MESEKKVCYSKISMQEWRKSSTHTKFDGNRDEKWLDRWILSPHLISAGLNVSLSSAYICLSVCTHTPQPPSLDCSHINTHMRRAADPVPLCGLLTCRWGHGWLKQWQVDSTLKLSIDPREPNQTANPPSLSTQALGRTEGEDMRRVRGQAPPLYPRRTLKYTVEKAMEGFLTLWCGFKQALWIHSADPAAFDQRSSGERNSPLLHFFFYSHNPEL